LTLSTESLVILSILGIMIGLFSFSLGVERGRSLAAESLDEKVSAAWNVGGRRLATVAPVSQVARAVTPTVGASKLSAANTMTKAGFTTRSMPVVKPVAGKMAPVAALASVPAAGSKWTVQLATYKNENYAQQEALGLKAKGYPSFIVKSKDFYLVCVGQFGAQSQADAFFKKLQAKYQGSQVRRF
jgi:cell division septation protein DedD